MKTENGNLANETCPLKLKTTSNFNNGVPTFYRFARPAAGRKKIARSADSPRKEENANKHANLATANWEMRPYKLKVKI